MTISKIPHPWAENGQLEPELTDDKRDIGWVSGDSPDRPTVQRFNQLQNETDNRFNALIEGGPSGLSEGGDLSDHVNAIYTDTNCFGSPFQAINELDMTDSVYDIAFALIGGQKRILVMTEQDLSFSVVNPSTMAIVETPTVSSSTLPDPGGAYPWSARHVVCDDTYAYIIFVAENASHAYYGDCQMQSYALSDWVVHPGWPTTGITLYNSTSTQVVRPINADATYLAISDTVNDRFVTIAKADGTMANGTGDWSSGSFSGVVATTGTYLIDAAGYTAQITSLGTGCGGTGWPGTTNASNVTAIGNVIFFSRPNDTFTLRVSTVDNFAIAYAESSVNAMKLGGMCTDGLNIWAQCQRALPNASNGITKISPHEMVDDGGSVDTLTDLERVCSIFAFGENVSHGTTVPSGRVVFDGRDIWSFDLSIDTSKLYRVPMALLR